MAPLELHQGIQASSSCSRNSGSSQVAIRILGFSLGNGDIRILLEWERRVRPPLTLRHGSPVSSRGVKGCQASYQLEVSRVSLKLWREPQVCPRVAMWKLGKPLSQSRAFGTHLKRRWGTWSSSPIAAGNSGFLLSCNVAPPETFDLPKGSEVSFWVARGTRDSSTVAAGFIGTPLSVEVGNLDPLRVATGS